MEEDSQEGIISLVNSIFDVDEFIKTEFTLEFKITNPEFQIKFEIQNKLSCISCACFAGSCSANIEHTFLCCFRPIFG